MARKAKAALTRAAMLSGRAGTGGSKGGGAGSGGAGSGGEAATSGASGASGSSGAAGDDGAAGAGGSGGAPPCDPNERPADGSFVSVSGNDTTGDGSASLPLKSIRQGLAAAAAAGKSVVYVDQGTYPESLALTTANSGVTVRGGFRATGATWQRDCSDGARAKTVVASPTNVGARVTGVTQKTTLESLTILTRASGSSSPGQAGESCYGVFVAGAGSPVSLVDVQSPPARVAPADRSPQRDRARACRVTPSPVAPMAHWERRAPMASARRRAPSAWMAMGAATERTPHQAPQVTRVPLALGRRSPRAAIRDAPEALDFA